MAGAGQGKDPFESVSFVSLTYCLRFDQVYPVCALLIFRKHSFPCGASGESGSVPPPLRFPPHDHNTFALLLSQLRVTPPFRKWFGILSFTSPLQ